MVELANIEDHEESPQYKHFTRSLTLPGNRNAVEFRHELRGVGKDVTDESHTVFRRIDVRVSHHELFQNVILWKQIRLVWNSIL